MNKKNLLLAVILLHIAFLINARTKSPWNGKKCAVVLSYDDALNVHLDKVIPALDTLGLKGTFYLFGESPAVEKRIYDWRKAAKEGHELGNHTLNHPCNAQDPDRSWVDKETNLGLYSLHRAIAEIQVNNTLLEAIDGKTERTFAYPCGDILIDTVHYYNRIKKLFVAARGVIPEITTIDQVDLDNVASYAMSDNSGEYMIELVKQACAKNGLLVFMFHGVGGEHDLNVSLTAHRQLIRYLKEHKKEIWVAPMIDVARFVRDQRATK